MITSELITPQHLNRKAIIYIRQSSPHQMLSNQESLRLQYALRQRGIDLGWSADRIEVIDCDLGQTAATMTHREGFKNLLAQVTLGEVGLILSYDVTRLSRNCSDWYPLLDVCGYRSCLIADRDGVYDPGSPNGRLLLGLKGQISEVELYTIRARLTAGILNKAQRGELALTLPVGLVRDESGIVSKDPNREIQDRIMLVFETFLQVKSASQVLVRFNQQDLLLPRRNRFGDPVWRKPTSSAIFSILKNPAYAGAFVYGRTRTVRSASNPQQTQQQKLPINEWKIRINDQYPAYIAWETYEQIQAQLRENYAEYDRNKTRGMARPGAALLHGLIYCGECGHKLVVQYKHSTRYICNFLRQQYRTPVCQTIPADFVDQQVVNLFFEAMSAVELNAYDQAVKTQQKSDAAVVKAHQQQLERLRYQAALAERQFQRVDPDHRLVAAELEHRWETALSELRQAETNQTQPESSQIAIALPESLKVALADIGQKLPELWQTDALSQVQKKSLLRCLIDKIVVHRVGHDIIRTRMIWKGGDTTTINVPVTVGAFADLTHAETLESCIVALSREGLADDRIAAQLTQAGYHSPMHLTLLPSTVKRIRLQHGIMLKPHQSHPRQIPGFLTVPQIATALEISSAWIYDRIHNGTIIITRAPDTKLYLFPDNAKTMTQFEQLKTGQRKTLRF